MRRSNLDGLFRSSVQAYRLGRLDQAARGFRHLIEAGSIEPLHESFHGLLLALHENRREEGLELCERAMVLAPDRPETYLNLARVHKRMGRRRQSIATLRRGLAVRPKSHALLREIQHVSPRRKPPFASLERNHPLNKVLGKLQARLGGT